MTPTEATTILRQFIERCVDCQFDDPLRVMEAIDAAVEIIERLEAAESEALEEARLNGVGSEREAALMAKLEAAEKERDATIRLADSLALALNTSNHERDALRAKIAEMDRQEPVAEIGQQYTLLFAGSGSITGVVKRHGLKIGDKLYALPVAKPAPNAVAYLDLGVGGYMDIGTDLTDEELDAIPKGRHMLGIVGTYGIDGYFPAQPAPRGPRPPCCHAYTRGQAMTERERFEAWARQRWTHPEDFDQRIKAPGKYNNYEVQAAWEAWQERAAQPAPIVPDGWKLVPIEPTPEMLRALIDGANQYDSWHEGYRAALAAAPEAKL